MFPSHYFSFLPNQFPTILKHRAFFMYSLIRKKEATANLPFEDQGSQRSSLELATNDVTDLDTRIKNRPLKVISNTLQSLAWRWGHWITHLILLFITLVIALRSSGKERREPKGGAIRQLESK